MSDTQTPKVAPAYLVPPVIAKAIIAIQKELQPLVKSAKNDAFGSTYVPLEDVTTKAHALLSARGIAVLQPPTTDEAGHAALETILVSASGQSFSRTTKLALNKVDPQAHGSAITYTRRYALMGILGLTGQGEDDDGNRATGVFVPVQQEQIDHLKTLLKHLKWPKKQIEQEVFNLKSRDAAAKAIANFEEVMSQRVRDDESKANASKIEVEGPEEASADETPIESLERRIKALGLAGLTAENKFVFMITGKPFLSKVKTEADMNLLSLALDKLESGERHLGADMYAPTTDERLVEEQVDI